MRTVRYTVPKFSQVEVLVLDCLLAFPYLRPEPCSHPFINSCEQGFHVRLFEVVYPSCYELPNTNLFPLVAFSVTSCGQFPDFFPQLRYVLSVDAHSNSVFCKMEPISQKLDALDVCFG